MPLLYEPEYLSSLAGCIDKQLPEALRLVHYCNLGFNVNVENWQLRLAQSMSVGERLEGTRTHPDS